MQDDCSTVVRGLPEVRVVREEETTEAFTVEVMYRTRSAPCPRCGQGTPKVHDVRVQRKRDRRLWDKPVVLLLHKRRFRCLGRQKVFTEPDPVFGSRRRSSQRFRVFLGREALHQTARHVAHKEGVGESLVRRCVTEEAKRLLGVPEKPQSTRILGLDEFSIRKGQVYDTAIMDIEEKQVLGVVSGGRQKDILNYFDHRYTNGFVEGKNNRIKVIKRIAYGYRNSHNFRQRILLTNCKEVASKAA